MSLDELDTRITTRRSDSGLDHLPWRSPSAGTARPAVRDVTEELSYRGLERRAAGVRRAVRRARDRARRRGGDHAAELGRVPRCDAGRWRVGPRSRR